MRILGVSAYYHDSAAALLEGGTIVAAAQEERFTRVKHDCNFPAKAIDYCLRQAGIGVDQVDHIVFYDKPFLKFERLLETYLAFAPRGFASFRRSMPIWIKQKLFQKAELRRQFKQFDQHIDWDKKFLFSEHHLSHAASAFYPSPFDEALVLTMDGVGEWATTSAAIGRGNDLKIHKELFFPHSLGLLYSALTYYLGFKVNSGEYKVMGLAPYGDPLFAELMMSKLMDLKADGTFRLNMDYFDYCTGLTMTSAEFGRLFGRSARHGQDQPLEQFHMDMAASVQAVAEEIVTRLVRALVAETGIDRVCLAGGVALNCVANGKLLREGHVHDLWVQPAAGDAGGALGAALLGHYYYKKQIRNTDRTQLDGMQGAFLGPAFEQTDIERRLGQCGARFDVLPDSEHMMEAVACLLAEQRVVGWCQGRMEFGPRALGARSILADPRCESMQKVLNLKVKYRESFRPFAPAVLREDVTRYFEADADSPYMLLVDKVRPEIRRPTTTEQSRLFGLDKLNLSRSELPAITHIDYTARVQTVHRQTNPLFYGLLQHFKQKTGCSVLINTSFNVRGEPPVCTPEDAFKCFMGTEMDALAVGNCLLLKQRQDTALKVDYSSAFEPD